LQVGESHHWQIIIGDAEDQSDALRVFYEVLQYWDTQIGGAEPRPSKRSATATENDRAEG